MSPKELPLPLYSATSSCPGRGAGGLSSEGRSPWNGEGSPLHELSGLLTLQSPATPEASPAAALEGVPVIAGPLTLGASRVKYFPSEEHRAKAFWGVPLALPPHHPPLSSLLGTTTQPSKPVSSSPEVRVRMGTRSYALQGLTQLLLARPVQRKHSVLSKRFSWARHFTYVIF